MSLPVVLLLLMTSGPPEVRAEAAACLRRGNDAFRAGQFQAAADEYGRAYALFPSTKLLYNLGKAYDGAGRKPEALDAFQRFLDGLGAEPPEVRGELTERASTARTRVDVLRAELRLPAASPAAARPPPPDLKLAALAGAPSPSPLPPALGHAAPPVTAPAAPPPVTLRETPPEPSTLYRLRWWAVGAGAVIVGAATTFFVLRWHRGRACSDEVIACL